MTEGTGEAAQGTGKGGNASQLVAQFVGFLYNF